MENKQTYIKADDNRIINEKCIRWVKKKLVSVWKYVPNQTGVIQKLVIRIKYVE